VRAVRGVGSRKGVAYELMINTAYSIIEIELILGCTAHPRTLIRFNLRAGTLCYQSLSQIQA
jgi:hypothetical protein